jgi:ClpP class serine protease
MNGRLAALAARHAGRPLLMTPPAAEELVRRIQALDERAFSRPGRIEALMRKLSGSHPQPTAFDDDGPGEDIPLHVRAAYAPLYIGEPEDIGYCWSLKNGVALMNANTPLLAEGEQFCGTVFHGYDTLLEAMRQARTDDRVKAIFLRFASPGGVVAGGLASLAAFMRANREAAGGKPIWVYADMACSAAYWIAAQADRVLAPAVGLVGSIGAVLLHENYASAMEKFGVVITAIQFGARKTDGAWWDALSPTAKADLQAEIDQCGRNFVADVALGRAALTPEAQLATEAGVFMAKHDDASRSGLALHFVDEISGEEEAFNALVAKISSSQSGPAAGNSPTPSAQAGRGDRETQKEKPMGHKNATRIAELKAEQARLEAEDKKTDPEDDKEKQETPGEQGDPEDDKEKQETPGEQGDPEDDKEKPEAEKIRNSPEAKAQPAMAMNAVVDGLTYAQFQNQVKALGVAPKRSALAEALVNSPRVGADAPQPEGGKAVIDTAGIYAGRKAATRR